jgi:3-deoxy-D-manno-octulosonic-acid transferase
MLQANAIIQLPKISGSAAGAELANALNSLLSDNSLRKDIGERALVVCDRNRGATDRTLQIIAGLLEKQNPAKASIPFPSLSLTATK